MMWYNDCIMTYNYSEDLRGLVVRKVASGMSQVAAAKMFEIHVTTIAKWIKSYRKSGILLPPKRAEYKKRVSDEDLLSYVNKRSDATLAEIAGHFNMGAASIFYRLKKLGITRKKNLRLRRA